MIVKPLGFEHVSECKEIEKLSFMGHRSDDFEKCLSDKNYLQFVAVDKNKVLGYVVVLFVADVAEIISIAVLPESRRLGVGRMLMEFSLKKSKDAGADSVMLEVNENNIGARRLYENQGFVTISIRKKYYNNSDDALIMKREL